MKDGQGRLGGLSFGLGVLQLIVGYLLTALAVTLGSPFWFDVLNRLMVIRSTVKPKEKSQEEGSEDRPTKAGAVQLVMTTPVAPPKVVPLAERPIDRDIYATVPAPEDKLVEEWH